MTKTAPSCRCGSWYRGNELEQISRNTLSGAGAPHPGISPPAGLAGCPLCLPTAHGPWGSASTLGLRLDNRISPDMRIIASRPATACLCADGCSPYTSLLKVGHGLLIPARLSSRTHIGRTQWTYSLPDCRQPAQARRKGRRACADWRRCRKSPHFDEVFRRPARPGRAPKSPFTYRRF